MATAWRGTGDQLHLRITDAHPPGRSSARNVSKEITMLFPSPLPQVFRLSGFLPAFCRRSGGQLVFLHEARGGGTRVR